MPLTAEHTPNLIASVADVLNPAGATQRWTVRTYFRPDDRFDLLLLPHRSAWAEDPRFRGDLARLEADAHVCAIAPGETSIAVRLADQCIAELGHELEERGLQPCDDLAAGRKFMIQYCDPNASKPLHVGHLRNVALGNALIHALATAGASVESRSSLADYGRNIAEAMAGVMAQRSHGEEGPEDQKSDHFVGRCYADYVAAHPGPSAASVARANIPLRREATHAGDPADAVLEALVREDPDTVALWLDVREQVAAGHASTLARLGVRIDRTELESERVPLSRAIAQRGLATGIFARDETGGVVYPTGREEYGTLPLLRADGVPTHHLRTLAYWVWAEPQLEDTTSVQLCGTEWHAHTVLVDEILERLQSQPQASLHPSGNVLHGMVTSAKRVVSSSEGTSLLIDDLLDAIARRLGDEASDRAVARVALGWFLLRPAASELEFDREKLFEPRESLGWAVELARAPRSTRNADESPIEDPDYRFAVVSSQHHWYHVRAAVATYDVAPLARHLSHFARWFVEAPRSDSAARVSRAVLDHASGALGLDGARVAA